MNAQPRYGRDACIAAAAALTMFSAISAPGRAAAQETCILEDTLPAAYANLHQPGLHQPAEMWPEVARGANGQLVRSSPTLAGHGQLVLGREAVFLYHLPVFMTNPVSHPHNFQVILEAEFADPGGTAHRRYIEDREDNPTNIYTALPPDFAQTALFLDYPGHPRLGRFDSVTVFRNHFERDGEEILDTPMNLPRLVHFRGLAPDQPKPADLAYVLFGRGDDLFLAHMLSAPPDFDHIVEVSVEGGSLPTDAAGNGLFVTLTSRGNAVGERLRPGEVVACSHSGQTIQLRVDAESYCEVGELAQVGLGDARECQPM